MHINYSNLISIENHFQAWCEFRKGKSKRLDVQSFERNLEDNLFELQQRLKSKTYRHGNYYSFYVHDPKQRHIHKACVTDRVVHHLLYTFLYKLFDKTFIYDSYSCRLNKGTHKGVKRLVKLTRIVSKNYSSPCFALKLDIKKFFASVDHEFLIRLLEKKIADGDILWLLKQIIYSFDSDLGEDKGIPLGNLISQIFANIYLNELDQFVKHELKVKYYLRYADDFVILNSDKSIYHQYTSILVKYLWDNLKLELHPQKIVLRKLNWGIDFLGYVVLPHYALPRTKTKKRMLRKLKERIGFDNFEKSLQSCLGHLRHASSFKLEQEIENQVWFWKSVL